MKLISGPAMAAIQAGEAIVTGAVKIIPAQPVIVPTEPTTTNAVVLSWWQLSGSTPSDVDARMGLGFYDSSGVHLSSNVWSPYSSTGTWDHRTLNATAPGGTAMIRVFQDHVNHTGTFSFIDAWIDDISLIVGGSAVTIVNPGATLSGSTGWTDIIGNIYPAGPSPTSSPGTSGGNAFGGIGATQAVAYQDVVVSTDPPATPPDAPAPLLLWGGYGPTTLDGEAYQGIGDRGFVQQTSAAIGGVAQGMTLGVSGIEAAALELLDPAEIKGASVVMRRLIFASDGRTLLDSAIWDRGRGDAVTSDETVGGTATIQLAVESAARGLGHSGARQRSDSDQRLINNTDGYFKHTSYAGEKTLYWGGKIPSNLSGGGSGSGGITINENVA